MTYKMFVWIQFSIFVVGIASFVGCAKMKVAVHPGAISNLDSYAYDVLLVEQDAINQARALYLSNSLPETAKVPLNKAIDQYNVTLAAWQAYHAGGQNQTVLQSALDSLVAAVGSLQQILNKKVTPAVPTRLDFPGDPYVHTYAT